MMQLTVRFPQMQAHWEHWVQFIAKRMIARSPESPIQVPEMSASDLQQCMNSQTEQLILIDVRQPEEYVVTQIPGSVLIPLPELEAGPGIVKTQQLLQGKTNYCLVTVCTAGVRSAKALAILEQSGIKGINLKGGIRGWQAATKP